MIAALAIVILAALLVFLGTRVPGLAAPTDGALQRLVLGALAGMVLFHLLATLLDLTGVGWSVLKLGAGLLILLALCLRFGPRTPEGEKRLLPSDLGWGDETALLVVVMFSLLALTLWVTTPDFIFHWGVKGHRYFLARGVDYTYLARSWSWTIHPDYPQLLPELYAASALAIGRFDPPLLMLWSAFFFVLLLAASREILRTGEPFVRQAGIALLAVALAAFAIRHQMAGAADWMPALALIAAIPALSRSPDAAGDLQIGVAAAVAAASKVEGVMLAGLLCLAQLARRPAEGPYLGLDRLLRLGALPALVILPWGLQVRRYHLFSVLNTGGLSWERAKIAGPAMIDAVNSPGWHGFAWVLLLLPLLALRRGSRAVAFVLAGQLAFYLWIYLVSAFDTKYYVAMSFPRLLFHLVPAMLVGVLGFVGCRVGRNEGVPLQ
ncbi:MAG TPA: hypothetical protein VGK45_03825 [Thermoanaerobaculia bacterium]